MAARLAPWDAGPCRLWPSPAGDPVDEPARPPVRVLGDGRLKFWNTVTTIAVSEGGTLLAGASLDGTVQVFETADGRRRAVIVPPVSPTELAFVPRGTTLAIAGAAGSVTLWDASSGRLAATLPDTFAPMACSRDGSLLATRAARQEIALWDATSGELRRTMQGHSTGVLQGLVFSHAGKMLASYGSDASVLLWDVASGQERRRFANAEKPRFSPDDAILAAGAKNGDLSLWDTRTGETQRTFDEGGFPLAFHPAGTTLVSKRQGRAILWSLATGEEIRTITEVPDVAAVSPDGKWLAGGDESYGEVGLWNLQQVVSRRTLSTLGPVTTLAFSPESATIVVGTRNRLLQVFAADTGTERTPAGQPMETADLNPDGGTLVVRRGNTVELVDATTGESLETLAGNAANLESLNFSPEGGLVAGFGGWDLFQTSLRLWKLANRTELSLAGEPLGNVRTMAFSPDSKLLACAGDSRLVTIWDMAQQAMRDTLDDFPDRVTALAFHPDGRRLAVACHNQSVVLWDLKAGSGKPLANRAGIVHQLVFQNDGKLLAGAADGRVLVWNLATGKPPAELATGAGTPTSIAFNPTGSGLVAAGDEGVLWLWTESAREGFHDDPDRVLRVGPPHGVIKRVLWSPAGRHLVTVNGNGTIYILQLRAQ